MSFETYANCFRSDSEVDSFRGEYMVINQNQFIRYGADRNTVKYIGKQN